MRGLRDVRAREGAERVRGDWRGLASSCRAVGCGAFTRLDKPYCTDHVHLCPHARRVLARSREAS